MDRIEPLFVTVESFSGPLDLLLQLIRKNRLQIEDIPLSEITSAYLQSMDQSVDIDTESAGDFLVLASELMYIKSRTLLPRPEDEEEIDPREELVKRLKLYEMFQNVTLVLSEHEKKHAGRILKLAEDITAYQSEPLELKGDLEALTSAFTELLQRKARQESEDGLVRQDFIRSEPFEISVAMERIQERVSHRPIGMKQLVHTNSVGEWIAVFISVLELIKIQFLTVSVEQGEIMLRRRELE